MYSSENNQHHSSLESLGMDSIASRKEAFLLLSLKRTILATRLEIAHKI